MEITNGERPSKDRLEPVSTGISQMNSPNCNRQDCFEQSF